MTLHFNPQHQTFDPQLTESGYQPFPNIEQRNVAQEYFEVPTLIRLMNLPQGQRMLEVGCGRGVALVPFTKHCQPRRLVGLDIDAELLKAAENRIAARHIPAELIHADVRRIPFPDDSFDIIVDFGTCYHITQSEVALREIARVLTVGGLFVHETRLTQFLSHPLRSFGHADLPWHVVPSLVLQRTAVLWSSRVKR